MADENVNPIPDKNVQVNGKLFGANSTIKLSVKTAFWIVTLLFSMITGVLSKSYFSLKKDMNTKHTEFVEKVDEKVDEMKQDITTILIGQEGMKGDIKLILDRQDRDNPVRSTNTYVPTVAPPSFTNVVPDENSVPSANSGGGE